MREFVFKEGGSDKFWRIELGDRSFDVTFGKTGSKGQKQRKTFGSAAEATRAHDALIAEKLRKGYTESSVAPAGKASAATKAVAATGTAAPAKAKAASPSAEAAPAAPRVAPTTATPSPADAVERRIDLDPRDWHWAAWRQLPPPPSATRPFDLDDCLARLSKVRPARYGGLALDKAGIGPGMTKEEARLWWECMVDVDGKGGGKPLADALRKKKLAPLSIKQVKSGLKHTRTYSGKELGYVLSALIEPLEVLKTFVLGGGLPVSNGHRGVGEPFYGLREDAFFRLTDAEKSELRELVRPELQPANFPTDFYDMPSGAFLLAPLLGGLGDELLRVVRSWKDDRYGAKSWDDSYHVPQHIVFGLGAAADVDAEMRRLRLKLRQPEYVRAWLAHTEYAALDYLAETVVAQTNKDEAAELARLACLVHAPENVAPMQAIAKKSKAPQVALAWLEEHASFGGGAKAKVESGKAPDNTSIDGADEIVAALAKSTLEAPDARLAAIRAKHDAAKLDAFAWSLFQQWMAEGAPPKEKWKLIAVGLLGGDASAHALAPLVRAWPGVSQHARAVLGLECLRAIGTDVALMHLSGIALKVKFQALKSRAEACMNEIAEARGLTRDELEDRIVPDAGFDDRGARTFSFGARAFTATLGPTGAPAVRDASGALKDDLPKPNAKDDASAAKAATEEWKLFKKTLRDAAKIQSERLERAMVTQRGWSARDFASLIVAHPLMGHLARLVVWATFDGGALGVPFRVAEDRSLAGADDASFELPKSATVRLVHPLSLTRAAHERWARVFSDYEIVTPFAQLGRATFAPEPNEKKADDVGARFAGRTYDVRSFTGRLRRAGWKHGTPEDAGYVGEHTKAFPTADVIAIVEHNGYPIGAPEYADPQRIEHVRFVRSDGGLRKRKHLEIRAVDPIVFSEVILDLTGLAG
ncbi:MAG: DUF4132 domain-containing protein [Polyangiaceae bacterium]